MSESRTRDAYDTVAAAYDAALRSELAAKPVDRALLDALLELCPGIVADVGCGPGHVTRHLAARHRAVVGVDLSPAMVSLAREAGPSISFEVGSMLDLPVADGAWSGIVAFYSIIHLAPAERARAFREFARALSSGGWVLVSFHVSAADQPPGSTQHLSSWFGSPVDLDSFYLDPASVTADLAAAGFSVAASTMRAPLPGVEYPSRRCYLLAQLDSERL
ncbi:methyltransferase [Asanoa ishikariensis]|uniref:Methyltransferase domain-containing protein n=1 Tax=Asanoa ishikariensis TaxID=137265 RepID=A0A1H3S311_9ACTN|nr:class I SAM-dependent methyltransferase [Asanoa ishikariensis]GIF66587.1 methyltransferase [Asanoa ishikariensis]SDZ31871.1 Methyltransferase domain-containing protein [Asanoa ishikariensis]